MPSRGPPGALRVGRLRWCAQGLLVRTSLAPPYSPPPPPRGQPSLVSLYINSLCPPYARRAARLSADPQTSSPHRLRSLPPTPFHQETSDRWDAKTSSGSAQPPVRIPPQLDPNQPRPKCLKKNPADNVGIHQQIPCSRPVYVHSRHASWLTCGVVDDSFSLIRNLFHPSMLKTRITTTQTTDTHYNPPLPRL